MASQSIKKGITWRHDCENKMWKVISNSVNISFIHSHIHGRSHKNIAPYSKVHVTTWTLLTGVYAYGSNNDEFLCDVEK